MFLAASFPIYMYMYNVVLVVVYYYSLSHMRSNKYMLIS